MISEEEEAIAAEQRRAMLRGAQSGALLRFVAKVEASVEAGEETPAAAVAMAEDASAELRDRGFLMTFPRPR